jgi:hypothetical protein
VPKGFIFHSYRTREDLVEVVEKVLDEELERQLAVTRQNAEKLVSHINRLLDIEMRQVR